MLDFLIRGGHVIDTASGVDGIAVVGVKDGKIVKAAETDAAVHVVDATGCYVFPGLIDAHTHSFFPGSGLGVQPDLQAATGVTTVLDAGTSGWTNYPAFHNTTVCNSMVRVKALVSYNNCGLVELGDGGENYDKKNIKVEKIRRLFERYPGQILGLKMRFQKEVTGDTGMRYLEDMLEVAEEIGCPVTVHTTNPPATASEIANALRPGDVYCHCYQGKSNAIVDENGHVYEAVRAARKRGVYFDAANGTNNFAFSAAIPAIRDGFLPDIISGDNASNSFGLDLYARNLPFVMAKYLTLGMTIQQIAKCVTETPAKLLGMSGKIGTLAEGAYADIAILKMVKKKQVYWDSVKNPSTAIEGDVTLVPQMTMIGGTVAFRTNDF